MGDSSRNKRKQCWTVGKGVEARRRGWMEGGGTTDEEVCVCVCV